MNINFESFLPRYEEYIKRGLSPGVGERDGQMCIEAVVCAALDLPHGDNPECVADAVRSYKIGLNDANWSSPEARAAGLHDLGIAQVGSKGVVDDTEFARLMQERTIRVLIPTLFRELFPNQPELLAAADRCEQEGTAEAAGGAAWAAVRAAEAAAVRAAARVVEAVRAARAAGWAAEAAGAARAAGWAAGAAEAAAGHTNKYLLLSASLALEVLRELGSPGCAYV